MTEKEMLVQMAKRLEASEVIDDVSYPIKENELSFRGKGWHGYWTRFRFDDAGNVIETSAGC